MRTLAVLPVKRFDAAKQRLAEGVDAAGRRELAAAMAADVMDALGAVGGLEDVVVVTGDEDAARLAAQRDIPVVEDPDDAGQSAAAARGVAVAVERGCSSVLLVPGDCPALDPVEVEGLLSAPRPAGPCVVVVPDRHGTGTNALLLAPPDAIAPAFGPGSRARHHERARAAGATAVEAALPSLVIDVDTPDDLVALRGALAARGGAAPRTRAVLERLAPVAGAAER